MTDKKTVLFEGESRFGHYQVVDMVYDGRPARMLFGDSDSPQSGEAQDNNPELLFSYNQRFLEITESCRPQRVLVIGGGAFSFPKALLERFADIHIDVVEIDPLLIDLSRRFFSLTDDDRLTIITEDGREYLDSCCTAYDLIVVDAFSEFDVPVALLTQQAIQRYAAHLTRRGVVAINFVAAYQDAKPTLAHRLLTDFRHEFTTAEIFPVELDGPRRGEQNLLLVASQQPDLALDYLQAAPISLSGNL
jgi:spermidine synthase